jgi:hypothetical protein
MRRVNEASRLRSALIDGSPEPVDRKAAVHRNHQVWGTLTQNLVRQVLAVCATCVQGGRISHCSPFWQCIRSQVPEAPSGGTHLIWLAVSKSEGCGVIQSTDCPLLNANSRVP